MRGADVARWRSALGLGQHKFARLVGVSQYRLSRIEGGVVALTDDERQRIEATLVELRAKARSA